MTTAPEPILQLLASLRLLLIIAPAPIKLLFPIIDESLQYFTPGRIPDVLDALADIAGGLSGIFLRKILK